MHKVEPVKLYVSIIYREETVRMDAKEFMTRRWGSIDHESDPLPFEAALPLKNEMGTPLFRSFVSFGPLIDPGELALVKMACMGLEEKFRVQGKRRANLDPGYIDSHKAVLATTHSGPTKVYHSAGIYLDTVLLFPKGKCQALPWSFPEFKNQDYDDIFLTLHALYKEQLTAAKLSEQTLLKK